MGNSDAHHRLRHGRLRLSGEPRLNSLYRQRKNVLRSPAGVDDERAFGTLKRVELRPQHVRFHKMMPPLLQTPQDQVFGRVEQQEFNRAANAFAEALPDAWRQRRATCEDRAGRRRRNRGGEGVDPRTAIGVRQRLALRHLFDIGGGVKIVALQKRGAEMRGESGGDRRFSGAGDAHDDESARACLHSVPGGATASIHV